MQLLLKDTPLLNIDNDGKCTILDFDRLPFALRKESLSFVEFMEWASNRVLSLGRSYAKEILDALRLSRTNRFAVCKACRGLSLEDSYWIRQDGDESSWREVNLFQNPLSLYVSEISLSGRSVHYQLSAEERSRVCTPELTTWGASAKSWIRRVDGLFLHKLGKYELPASEILDAVKIAHIPYFLSGPEEVAAFLSEERREWMESVGEVLVNSELFTSERRSMVTFEEFKTFCGHYGLNPYEEAVKIDREAYFQMQIADFLLNNNDRHEQNWGFFMDNESGKITGYCPLFDHDHAFDSYEKNMSQTTEEPVLLKDAALWAQSWQRLDLSALEGMECPAFLSEKQWEKVLKRKRILEACLE